MDCSSALVLDHQYDVHREDTMIDAQVWFCFSPILFLSLEGSRWCLLF